MASSKKLSSSGFTIVELLVATAVFSVVLLVCSIALLQIGRSYYKGITVTKTQEVARNVIDEIAMSVEFSSNGVTTLPRTVNSEGYCIGSTRYSYLPGKPVKEDGSTHGLVVDKPTSGCTAGSAQNLEAPLTSDSKELLAPGMRVSKLTISSPNPITRLTTINIRIVAGDDDLLTDPNGPTANCSGVLAGSQFCTAIELTTTVQKRVQ